MLLTTTTTHYYNNKYYSIIILIIITTTTIIHAEPKINIPNNNNLRNNRTNITTTHSLTKCNRTHGRYYQLDENFKSNLYQLGNFSKDVLKLNVTNKYPYCPKGFACVLSG